MHANDKGMATGDTVAFMAYGWMRVPVVIESKQGSGMTRTATVRLVDPKSVRRGGDWSNSPKWKQSFNTNIKCLEPM